MQMTQSREIPGALATSSESSTWNNYNSRTAVTVDAVAAAADGHIAAKVGEFPAGFRQSGHQREELRPQPIDAFHLKFKKIYNQ